MRITDIKVFPVREDKLKAFVSIILDDCFMVNDIKVIKGKEGMFISMPSRRKRNGKFKDIAHPLNNDTRQAMEAEILAAYEASDHEGLGDGAQAEARPRKPSRRRRGRSQKGREPRPDREEPVSSRPAAGDSGEQAEGGRPKPEATPSAVESASRREDRGGKQQAGTEGAPADSGSGDGKSADEVAEHHLRDSFWGT